MEVRTTPVQVEVHAPICAAAEEILTPSALRFVGFLCLKFEDRRRALLAAREAKKLEYDGGDVPTFVSKSNNRAVNDPHWRCAAPPQDLQDRRVEITGPTDRKMVINGLNSGACVYMADFEDSLSPTWSNLTEGQRNLRDAVRGVITYKNKNTGKVYALKKTSVATLFVRPRGWHLDEAHVKVNGRVVSGALFDFGLFLFHNVHKLISNGTRPYFYLPKLEGYLEARLWNDVFVAAQNYLGVPVGTIRATVLLETITAAFEMEEILYELKDHSVGLNCGRWDYLFSFIKKFKNHPDKITPDRSFLTMQIPLMEAYVKRLIYICHKRGTFAMGGMAAQIPIKNDAQANEVAMNKIIADKLREVRAGHDGTWVAHPALVSIAKDVFNKEMKTPNQIHNLMPAGESITEDDLLRLPSNIPADKRITSHHLETGITIVLGYTEAWLRGVGCIPIDHKMEDAATAEISRAQIWQWRQNGETTQDDNMLITSSRIKNMVRHLVGKHSTGHHHHHGKWLLAGKLVTDMLTKGELDDFLTTVCYPHILTTAYEGDIVPEDDVPNSRL